MPIVKPFLIKEPVPLPPRIPYFQNLNLLDQDHLHREEVQDLQGNYVMMGIRIMRIGGPDMAGEEHIAGEEVEEEVFPGMGEEETMTGSLMLICRKRLSGNCGSIGRKVCLCCCFWGRGDSDFMGKRAWVYVFIYNKSDTEFSIINQHPPITKIIKPQTPNSIQPDNHYKLKP